MKAAVTELSALLDKAAAAQHRPAPAALAPVKGEEEREVTPLEERQHFNKDITVAHTHVHTRCCLTRARGRVSGFAVANNCVTTKVSFLCESV